MASPRWLGSAWIALLLLLSLCWLPSLSLSAPPIVGTLDANGVFVSDPLPLVSQGQLLKLLLSPAAGGAVNASMQASLRTGGGADFMGVLEGNFKASTPATATALFCPEQPGGVSTPTNYSVLVTGTPFQPFRLELSTFPGVLAVDYPMEPFTLTANEMALGYFKLTDAQVDAIQSLEIWADDLSGCLANDYPDCPANILAKLWVGSQPQGCPTPDTLLAPSDFSSRLTFQEKGTIILNRGSHPRLEANKYFYVALLNLGEMANIYTGNEAADNAAVDGFSMPKRLRLKINTVTKPSRAGAIAAIALMSVVAVAIVLWLATGCCQTDEYNFGCMPRVTPQNHAAPGQGWDAFWNLLDHWMETPPTSGPNTQRYRHNTWPWFMLTLGVAFGVAGFQFTFSTRRIMTLTGDRDQCFYNERCYRPLWWSNDLPNNNLLSNVSYIVLGFAFLIFVAVQEFFWRFTSHSGLWYAFGWALVGEGFCSLGYHVCPRPEIFQLDTVCMYGICLMGIFALYQYAEQDDPVYVKDRIANPRVPEPAADDSDAATFRVAKYQAPVFKASKVFVFFYLVLIIINWIGAYPHNNHTSGALLLVVYFFAYLFVLHRFGILHSLRSCGTSPTEWWSRTRPLPKNVWEKNRCCCCNATLGVVIYAVLCAALGIGFPVAVIVGEETSSMILNSLIALLGLTFMLISGLRWKRFMKHSKGPLKAVWISLLVLAAGFFGAGFYMFSQKGVSDKTSAPAVSRNANRECLPGSDFDYHDLWHFLSGVGLFLFGILFYYTNPPSPDPEYLLPQNAGANGAANEGGNGGGNGGANAGGNGGGDGAAGGAGSGSGSSALNIGVLPAVPPQPGVAFTPPTPVPSTGATPGTEFQRIPLVRAEAKSDDPIPAQI